MARFLAAGDWVKAADPPNGPARAEFCSLATHTPVAPPAVPEHVMPAGIWIATGKSMVVAPERPPMPIPGTFWVTWAVWKADASVPPDVGSTIAVRGPAPSWLTWWKLMLTVPSSEQVGRPDVAPAPVAALTAVSEVPFAVLTPPLAARTPRERRCIIASWSSRAALAAVVLAFPPMKAEIILEASTGPVLVRPRAVALLVPSSLLRMMEVSASAPQLGVAQSRGVPSATKKSGISLGSLGLRMDSFTGETRHSYCVGTCDGLYDTVAEDIGSSERHKEDC